MRWPESWRSSDKLIIRITFVAARHYVFQVDLSPLRQKKEDLMHCLLHNHFLDASELIHLCFSNSLVARTNAYDNCRHSFEFVVSQSRAGDSKESKEEDHRRINIQCVKSLVYKPQVRTSLWSRGS